MPKATVLLLADSAEDALVLRTALHLAGADADFVTTTDGATALRYLRAEEMHEGVPMRADLVLVDISLRSVIPELARLAAPVVCFTKDAPPPDITACGCSGASACIAKPVEWTGYENLVRRLLRYLPTREESSRAITATGG
jgi:CheY-like chemotaxis protein